MNQEKRVKEVEVFINDEGFRYLDKAIHRPWGAFWNIDPQMLSRFLSRYFPELKPENTPLTPKILLLEKGQRLSLQRHQRRSELWKVLQGSVNVILESTVQVLENTAQITIPINTSHRLEAREGYALMAEIWIHHNPLHLSDEEDIERMEDEFHRTNPISF